MHDARNDFRVATGHAPEDIEPGRLARLSTNGRRNVGTWVCCHPLTARWRRQLSVTRTSLRLHTSMRTQIFPSGARLRCLYESKESTR